MSNPTLPSPTIPGSTTLTAIRTKFRRLTLAPSTAQISDADIDHYINTYAVYDFPEQLRTFNLKTTFEFFTNPGQDVYNTDIDSFGINPAAINVPLYNFQNKYISVHPPFYCSGYGMYFTQYVDQFWAQYTSLATIQSIGVSGDGVTQQFTGTITSSQAVPPQPGDQMPGLVQRTVMFNAIAANTSGLSMVDIPVIDIYGNKLGVGNLYDTNSAAYQTALRTPPTVVDVNNTINYQTGVYTVTFTVPPAIDSIINSQAVFYQAAQPRSILYFSNTFTVRPIPDQVYRISFEVFQRPTALLNAGQSPELEEYWQLIAIGAARKYLQDRMDFDTLALIEPEFEEQKTLCIRRTYVQLSNQRAPTIYSVSDGGPNNNQWTNFPF